MHCKSFIPGSNPGGASREAQAPRALLAGFLPSDVTGAARIQRPRASEDASGPLGPDRTVGSSRAYRRRLVVVAHVESNDHIRIISARLATRAERRFYEQEE